MSGFADEVQLHARGGDGGAGSVSFRREAHVPRGGPDGGDGGAGGSVWLVADHNVASLLAFRDHPHRRATSGVHGQGKRKHGRSGEDLEVAVPPGTVVRGPDGEVLVDLVHPGDRWQAARGGQGGRGNARFLSNRRRAPNFAEQGEPGEERWLGLELKLLADVALVGFPNVGKSTLISRISAAKPRIADYPFTTLEPNLGVVRTDDGTEMVVADVPGLIEGASEGRGLGHRFLRHVERARVLAVLLDLSPLAERPPAEQEEVLLRELAAYQPDLVERPRVVVGSRADLAQALSGSVPEGRPAEGTALQPGPGLVAPAEPPVEDVLGTEPSADAAPAESSVGVDATAAPRVEHVIGTERSADITSDQGTAETDLSTDGVPSPPPGSGPRFDHVISAVTGHGLPALVGQLAELVRAARAETPITEGFVVHRPALAGIGVVRDDDGALRVVGRAAERAVALSDITTPEAQVYVRERLDRLGVPKALVKAGARDGDEVRIGTFSFDYVADDRPG